MKNKLKTVFSVLVATTMLIMSGCGNNSDSKMSDEEIEDIVSKRVEEALAEKTDEPQTTTKTPEATEETAEITSEEVPELSEENQEENTNWIDTIRFEQEENDTDIFDETKLDLPQERATDLDEMWTVLPEIPLTPVSNFEYETICPEINHVEIKVTGYKGSSDSVRIPALIRGLPVTEVDLYGAISEESVEEIDYGIKELIVPDTVRAIEINKDTIEYMNIPAGAYVYMYDSGLNPDNGAVRPFKSLKGLYLCSNYFNSCLVEDCKDITILRNGEKYTSNNLKDMDSSLIPYRITAKKTNETISVDYCYISEEYKNEVVTKYYISDCLNAVESLKIPDYVDVIDRYAFKDCTKLKTVIIPEGVEAIGSESFNGCTSLTSISLPDSIKIVGWFNRYRDSSPFSGCTSLSEMRIGSGLKSTVGSLSLSNSIKKLTIKGISNYSVFCDDGSPLDPNDLKNIGKLFPYIETLIIEEGTKSIPDRSFANHEYLKTVILPKSLEEIGESAFEGCTKITEIKIPDGVKTIKNCAFMGCTSLNSVVFGKRLKTIGSFEVATGREMMDLDYTSTGAFEQCISLKKVTLPVNVETIGEKTFKGCTALQKVNLSEGLKKIGFSAFSECSDSLQISLPDSIEFLGTYRLSDAPLGTVATIWAICNNPISYKNNNYSEYRQIEELHTMINENYFETKCGDPKYYEKIPI